MPGLLPALSDLLLPTPCVGCGRPGASWCEECHEDFDRLRRVHRPVLAAGPAVYALADYAGAARRGVLAYKEQGIRELAAPFAAALVEVLPWLPAARVGPDGGWWLVSVPSRRVAARRRGGDHMARLARRCARLLSATGRPAAVAPGLRVDRSAADSVGLGVADRLANLDGRIHPRADGLPPPGVPVVLLDDVVTTGATAVTAARALADAGTPVAAVLALTEVP